MRDNLLKRRFKEALHIGDIFAKLAAFVGIPSAIIAGTLYWNEIWDKFTTPDFTAEIETVEIRCGVILSSQEEVNYASSNFDRVCGGAPLAVSFKMLAKNDDTIRRTIISMSATMYSDLFERDISLPVTHIIDEVITNYVRSTSQVPWGSQVFDQGQQRHIEVQFSPILSDQKLEFSQFRDRFSIEPDEVANSSMIIKVSARFAGVDRKVQIAKCEIIFEPGSVRRFAAKPLATQVAYIRRCESVNLP